MTGRVLLVTPVVPSDRGNGLAMRAGMWLSALAKLGPVDLAVLPIYPAPSTAADFARSLSTSVTVLRARFISSAAEDARIEVESESLESLSRIAQDSTLVVIFRLAAADLVSAALPDVPRILDLDDLDWVREERLGRQEAARSALARAQQLAPECRLLVVANSADLSAFRAVAPGIPVMALPNVVDEPRDRAEVADARGGTHEIDLLFVGTLGYEPNMRGVEWVIDQVLPWLPGVTFAAVGALPPPNMLGRASDRVRIVANPRSVTPWYRAARVAVVPLWAGSGTRTKIPEAWAHEVPIVSTPIGAEGFCEERSDGLLIAADPESFAAHCRALLASPDHASELVTAGLRRYREGYTPEVAARSVQSAVRAALEGHQP